jgi:peptide-methionine (R)-S-oxide reductase
MRAHCKYALLTALAFLIFGITVGCSQRREMPEVTSRLETKKVVQIKMYSHEKRGFVMGDKIVKTEAEWKKQLTPEQYDILREKGTEMAGSGKYANHHEQGIYRCAGCGLDLFRSEDKYESGTGWPSFFAPISPENIATATDNSLFSRRTEVVCRRCGGHLGHVFEDGPKPTGLRYCMNSAALDFATAGK